MQICRRSSQQHCRNRYIVECKESKSLSIVSVSNVEIDTLWNVKIEDTFVVGNTLMVEIDTLWNVKQNARIPSTSSRSG